MRGVVSGTHVGLDSLQVLPIIYGRCIATLPEGLDETAEDMKTWQKATPNMLSK